MELVILLTTPPYGKSRATEALWHAGDALSTDIALRMILVDGGIFLAQKGLFSGKKGFSNLEKSLKDIIDKGGEVVVEGSSLREFGLGTDDLIDSVQVVSGYEISEKIKAADNTIIF